MVTQVKGQDARQGDRGWTLARALIVAMLLGGVVLIGLELYGSYVQPEEAAISAPSQTAETADDSQNDDSLN